MPKSTDVVVVYGAQVPSDRVVDFVYELTDVSDITPRPADNNEAFKLICHSLWDSIPILDSPYHLEALSCEDGPQEGRTFIVLKRVWVHSDAEKEAPIELLGPSKKDRQDFRAWLEKKGLSLKYSKYLVVCNW